MMISRGFFFIFDILIFQGVRGGGGGGGEGSKRQKIAQDDKRIPSVELHISGTIHHMILINGTHV